MCSFAAAAAARNPSLTATDARPYVPDVSGRTSAIDAVTRRGVAVDSSSFLAGVVCAADNAGYAQAAMTSAATNAEAIRVKTRRHWRWTDMRRLRI